MVLVRVAWLVMLVVWGLVLLTVTVNLMVAVEKAGMMPARVVLLAWISRVLV